MTKTCSTSGWSRHSSRTPSPTIPVAPVMIALIFIIDFDRWLRSRQCEIADAERSFGLYLVLLRHKFLRPRILACVLQYGHRGSNLTSASIIRIRMVAIEFVMCRSGRKGGSSGSVTVG